MSNSTKEGSREEREPCREQAAPQDRLRYVSPGLWSCMIDQKIDSSDLKKDDSFSSIAEQLALELLEKRNWKRNLRIECQELKETYKGFCPDLEDLKELHRSYKASEWRIQIHEMMKHPLRSVRSIFQSWKYNREVRKRMLDDLETLIYGNSDSGHIQG